MRFTYFFKRFWAGVRSLCVEAAKTTVGKLAEGLSKIAVEVVKELTADAVMGGAEKRQIAFSRIEDKAKAEGVEFSGHAINIAIELALAVVKEAATQVAQGK